jgi:hypothetical protein
MARAVGGVSVSWSCTRMGRQVAQSVAPPVPAQLASRIANAIHVAVHFIAYLPRARGALL